MSKGANLDGHLSQLQLFVLGLAYLPDFWLDQRSLRFVKTLPITDEVDEAFFEDTWGTDTAGKIRPGDWIAGD